MASDFNAKGEDFRQLLSLLFNSAKQEGDNGSKDSSDPLRSMGVSSDVPTTQPPLDKSASPPANIPGRRLQSLKEEELASAHEASQTDGNELESQLNRLLTQRTQPAWNPNLPAPIAKHTDSHQSLRGPAASGAFAAPAAGRHIDPGLAAEVEYALRSHPSFSDTTPRSVISASTQPIDSTASKIAWSPPKRDIDRSNSSRDMGNGVIDAYAAPQPHRRSTISESDLIDVYIKLHSRQPTREELVQFSLMMGMESEIVWTQGIHPEVQQWDPLAFSHPPAANAALRTSPPTEAGLKGNGPNSMRAVPLIHAASLSAPHRSAIPAYAGDHQHKSYSRPAANAALALGISRVDYAPMPPSARATHPEKPISFLLGSRAANLTTPTEEPWARPSPALVHQEGDQYRCESLPSADASRSIEDFGTQEDEYLDLSISIIDAALSICPPGLWQEI